MSTINKNGEIELTHEEQESLRGRKNLDVDGLMNWIVWGNNKSFYKPSNVKKV